ncbi:hypothetical protein AB0D10_10140 [Kitasatospora sp. NPDC048545]|uniref:hypothetical protein n=1 Tax=Kitasatospora sp. NPDC048545 TaxID=3157208 RepID=UPI0033BFC026
MPAAPLAGLAVALVHCLCAGTGRIPVPPKYRAALGDFVSCSLHAAPTDADACPSCSGTLRVVDLDGALSGATGAFVPCDCIGSHHYGRYGACPCHIDVWDDNDGHTGWVPVPLNEWTDDAPYFRPCPEHTPNARPVLAVAA